MSVVGDSPQLMRFGAFELDVRAGELRKLGVRLPIQGLPLQVLAILLSNTGRVVTREELRTQLWPADTFVDFDHGIHNAIARLREALGDSAGKPRFIETLPRRGYRFIGPAETLPGAVSVSDLQPAEASSGHLARLRWWIVAGLVVVLFTVTIVLALTVRPGSSPFIRSLAVLPLENLSGDSGQDYFAEGLTDELITELARLPTIRVISRRSVTVYRGAHLAVPRIARDLNVDAIVEGSVVRSGSHVRITAQLIDARADRHLWAQSFEGELQDLVTLQDDLAHRVAEQIRSQLPPADEAKLVRNRALDPGVHDLYLRGIVLRDVNDKISLDKSIRCFEQALQKNPHYAPAYAGLAVAYTFESYLGVLSSRETFQRADAAARKAIEEDPSLSEAHAALGWVALRYRWDWPTAEHELKMALELTPNDPDAHHFYSHYLLDIGRTNEGLEEGQKGLELDPLSEIQKNHLVWQYEMTRQFDRAIKLGKKVLESSATDPDQYVLVANAYAGNGELEDAALVLKKGISLSSARTGPQIGLARVFALSGNRSEAQKILDSVKNLPPTQYVSPVDIAGVYCALGAKQHAFEWLERAYQERDTSLADLRILPAFDSLHGEPHFQELLRRIGPAPK